MDEPNEEASGKLIVDTLLELMGSISRLEDRLQSVERTLRLQEAVIDRLTVGLGAQGKIIEKLTGIPGDAPNQGPINLN